MEEEGITRALRAAASAHVIVLVMDSMALGAQHADVAVMLRTLWAQAGWSDSAHPEGSGIRQLPGFGDAAQSAVGMGREPLSGFGEGAHVSGEAPERVDEDGHTGSGKVLAHKEVGGQGQMGSREPSASHKAGEKDIEGSHLGANEQKEWVGDANAGAPGFKLGKAQHDTCSESFASKSGGASYSFVKSVQEHGEAMSCGLATGEGLDEPGEIQGRCAWDPGPNDASDLNRLRSAHQDDVLLQDTADSALEYVPGEAEDMRSAASVPLNLPPTLILLNKCDVLDEEGMDARLVSEVVMDWDHKRLGFPLDAADTQKQGSVRVFRVSCKTGEGMDDVAEALTDAVHQLSGDSAIQEGVTVVTRYALQPSPGTFFTRCYMLHVGRVMSQVAPI